MAALVLAVPAAFEFLQFFIQPVGADFRAIWAGGRAALLDPAHLYDFGWVTRLQEWPGGSQALRPYPYPPSALPLVAPLALLPWPIAYAMWTAVSLPFFAWAGRRAGAPAAWILLAPWVIFAVFCGQLTLFLGALIVLGLTERAARPILAGVLFGAAAAIKPQLLVLLPVALVAERRWRVLIATGAAGAGVCALSALVWGVGPWLAWFSALPDFTELVARNTQLNLNTVTPAAALRTWGLDPRWALLAWPLAGLWTWRTFRRGPGFEVALIVLAGAAMLVAPYVMVYDLALFAPATAIYLTRTDDRRWPAYVLATLIQHAPPPGVIRLMAALAPALLSSRKGRGRAT